MAFNSSPEDSPPPYEDPTSSTRPPANPDSPLLPMARKKRRRQQAAPVEATNPRANYGTMVPVGGGDSTRSTITNPPTSPASQLLKKDISEASNTPATAATPLLPAVTTTSELAAAEDGAINQAERKATRNPFVRGCRAIKDWAVDIERNRNLDHLTTEYIQNRVKYTAAGCIAITSWAQKFPVVRSQVLLPESSRLIRLQWVSYMVMGLVVAWVLISMFMRGRKWALMGDITVLIVVVVVTCGINGEAAGKRLEGLLDMLPGRKGPQAACA